MQLYCCIFRNYLVFSLIGGSDFINRKGGLSVRLQLLWKISLILLLDSRWWIFPRFQGLLAQTCQIKTRVDG